MEERIEAVVRVLNEVIEEGNIDASMHEQDLQELGLDSISFVKTIIGLEDEFDIEVPDKYLNIHDMNTIDKIVAVLNELVA